MIRIAVLLLYFGLVVGQTSIKDECEKKVKDNFDVVKNSYVIPSHFSVPSSFDEITNLLNRLNKLISNIVDLSDVEKNQEDIEKTILDANKIEQLKKGIELLKSIYYKTEFLKASRIRTKNECEIAYGKYNTLVNDFNAIEKLGSAGNKSVAQISGKIKRTNEKSIQVEDEFHSLNIPDFITANYLCSTRLTDTFEDLVLTARRIKNILIQQKEEILSNLRDISGKIANIDKPGIVPKPIFEGGEGNAIKKLQEQVDDLKNRIERYKQMKVPLLNWDAVILKLEQRLREDIRNAEEIKKLLVQRDESKLAFEEIGKIVQGLCERGVCNITEAVTVEQ